MRKASGRRLAAVLAAGLASLLLAVAASCSLPRFGSGEAVLEEEPPAGECEEPVDCPGRFLDCRAPSCINTTCGTDLAEVGEDCDDDGGAVCDGQGNCVECTDARHCGANEICRDNFCVPDHCGDGQLNGGETDLDCGGPCGRTCELNQSCDDWDDCKTGVCVGGLCSPCAVTDDCVPTEWCDAGICVRDKQDGDICITGEQCASGFCPEDGVCCNQDCTGLCMACIPGQTGLGLGECGPVLAGDDFKAECPVQAPASCGSNGTGCNGTGACHVYPSGTECRSASCTDGERERPDTCDGAGTCDDGGIQTCSPYQCSGTDCRSSCSDDSHCLAGSYCDAAGHCVSQGAQGDPCGGSNECDSGFCVDGRCCESGCTGECMACSYGKTGLANGLCRSIPTDPMPNDPDGECAQGACYRIDPTHGECRFFKGHACGGSTRCLTLPCVDGYCCENSCTGPCLSCAGAENIAGNGDCAAVTSGTDPAGECPDEGETSCGSSGLGCNGAGACILYPSGTVCNGASCDGSIAHPPDLCNGAGACQDSGTQSCNPYPCQGGTCLTSCSGQADCAAGYFCNASQLCQATLAQGQACGAHYECTNQRCVDGYCCNSNCAADCQSCDGDFNTGGNGVCSAVRAGEDPGGDCDYDCDGAGQCQPADGTPCTLPSQCGSGYCVDGLCCDSACTGLCHACRGDQTVGADGECAEIIDGTDPAGECPGIHVCLTGGDCS
ncbi:MAG: hypothetical protein JRI23_09355 [Deltaproteobacteria bacterium]|nr:hypothetical protein [Deltaproteobacteria bacterium]MBW2531855.1 hypothetical protein [Deltaproteobacteria bacterium]